MKCPTIAKQACARFITENEPLRLDWEYLPPELRAEILRLTLRWRSVGDLGSLLSLTALEKVGPSSFFSLSSDCDLSFLPFLSFSFSVLFSLTSVFALLSVTCSFPFSCVKAYDSDSLFYAIFCSFFLLSSSHRTYLHIYVCLYVLRDCVGLESKT